MRALWPGPRASGGLALSTELDRKLHHSPLAALSRKVAEGGNAHRRAIPYRGSIGGLTTADKHCEFKRFGRRLSRWRRLPSPRSLRRGARHGPHPELGTDWAADPLLTKAPEPPGDRSFSVRRRMHRPRPEAPLAQARGLEGRSRRRSERGDAPEGAAGSPLCLKPPLFGLAAITLPSRGAHWKSLFEASCWQEAPQDKGGCCDVRSEGGAAAGRRSRG